MYSALVKRLTVASNEHAHCDYCERKLRGRAVLVRLDGEDHKLLHMLLFCDTGCALAWATYVDPVDGSVHPPERLAVH